MKKQHLNQHFNSREHNEIVYYNCSIVNNKTVDDGSTNYVRFQESRDTDIIDDVSKYYFSIIRFDINGANKSLPVCIPKIKTGQPNVNLTVYKIGLQLEVEYSVGGLLKTDKFITTQTLEYRPQSTETYNVQPPLEKQDYSPYYYMYNYTQFANMVNFSFTEGLNQLNQDFKGWYGAGASDLTTKAPYIRWNPSTECFDLYTDIYSSSDNPSALPNKKEKLKIFFNSELYNLISYNAIYNGGDTIQANTLNIPDFTYEILINFDSNNVIKEIGNDGNPTGTIYLKTLQDYKSTTTLWNPIEAIVFSSTLIPVVSEQVGQPIEINDSISSRSTRSNFQPIITDISLDTNDASAYRNFISYIPSNEYRLSELKGNGPLRDIGINLFYRLRATQQLIPMEMINGSSINVKIMFRKKDF